MPTQATLQPFRDRLRIPAVIHPALLPNATAKIEMRTGEKKLHHDLPLTPYWGYDGTYPGPTIEVHRGHRIHIEWINALKKCYSWAEIPPDIRRTLETTVPHSPAFRLCLPAAFPVKSVEAPNDTQHEAGESGGIVNDLSTVAPFTVVHLHGAKTHPDSDGWTENTMHVDQSSLYTYDNDDRASMYWYHDHAMAVTRFNVIAGLAGIYIVRDAEELNLHLPSGEYEIPLLLQDRNLETEADGTLTGKLLHKIEVETMEFFGPFNLVNGKIWPYAEVKRAVYRFRIVNGSNARTYKLQLWDDESNTRFTTRILTQIGSDGGLFAAPVPLTENVLILAPGERADVIADFRSNALNGKSLNWVNVAGAPFGGDEVAVVNPKNLNDEERLALRQQNACVMQFQVLHTATVVNNFTMPAVLSHTFTRMSHTTLPADHEHRLIALVEEVPEEGEKAMVMLRELKTVDITEGETIPDGEFNLTLGGVLYKSVAAMFYDPISFFIRYGGVEVWKIINLTGDTHPFHVHLVQFQALGRQGVLPEIPDNEADTNAVGAKTFNITLTPPSAPDESRLDENEKGWKDTVRVNPGEMMTIAMTFDGHCGRYMYHCHLLEHEDHEMMRPIVVLPGYVLDRMGMEEHHHHH